MKKFRVKIRQTYYFLCFRYARIIMLISAHWRHFVLRVPFPYCFLWGRRESSEPIKCECGWAGMVKWLVHTYQDDGSGEEVEPVDECPRCGKYL